MSDYREIPLTQGQVCRVSAHRFEYLSQWKWHAWQSADGNYYARRAGRKADGAKTIVAMHRQILGLVEGDGLIGDHVNGDTLNNTDENIRIADPSQSSANQKKKVQNKSGFKGVHFDRRKQKWMAFINWRRKFYFLGYFPTPEAAAQAYAKAAEDMHGDFRRIA